MESHVRKIITDAKVDLTVCDKEVTQAITHLIDIVVTNGKANGKKNGFCHSSC